MHLPFVNLGVKSQPNSFDAHRFETLCLQHTLDRLSLILQNPRLSRFIYLFREQSLSMTGRGGGRNLNFSAKHFIPHKNRTLYFHAPENIFDFISYPQLLSKKSLL